MEKLERFGAWFAVAKAVAAQLGMQVTDVSINDFWPSAAGLRVAYSLRDYLHAGEKQMTIRLDANEASMIFMCAR